MEKYNDDELLVVMYKLRKQMEEALRVFIDLQFKIDVCVQQRDAYIKIVNKYEEKFEREIYKAYRMLLDVTESYNGGEKECSNG